MTKNTKLEERIKEFTCNFCSREAEYEILLKRIGVWAFVCRHHFRVFDGEIGYGKGVKLSEDSGVVK